VAWRIPASAADAEAAGAVGAPLAGWAHALGMVIGGGDVPDAPVGPLGAILLAGMRALAPTALAAVLAIVAFQGTPREPPGSVKAG
jgi:hypothetical protein